MALAAPSSLRRLPATPPQARSPPPASRLREPRLRLRLRRSLVAAAAAAAPLSASASPEDKERRKHELLRAVQETRRGFAAGPDQRAAIEEAVVRTTPAAYSRVILYSRVVAPFVKRRRGSV